MSAARRLKMVALAATAIVVVASAALLAPRSGMAGAPVVIGGHRPEAPAVSGSRVVFSDNRFGSYDIFLYDGTTGMTTRLTSDPTDEITPDISGDTVVYAVRGGSAGADIHAYDIPTRTVRVLAGGTGDQVNPSIDGRHVTWEDRAGGYAAQIWAIDLTAGAPFRVDPSNAAGYPRQRPRVGGGYIVYEDYPRNNTTRDGDVMLYDIATKVRTRVAGTEANEFVPVTDGTYVVWADGSGGDLDIRGYEISTGETFAVRSQPGEQTLPQIGAGLVYWMDNSSDGRLHVDVRDLDAGTTRPLDTYSVREVHAIATDGRAVAWLEPTRNGAQVRAILDPTAVTADAVATMLPTTPAWTPFRLASISTGGDGEAPSVLSASVDPGETYVDADSSLTVYFDEPLDADASASALTLTDESGIAVEGTVAYSGLARALTFTPAEPLGEGTFALTVEPHVTDTAGNVSDVETVVTFSTVGALADVAAPSQPGNPRARVAGLSNIELTWQASNDDVGVDAYDIYRHSVPISSANLGSATLVTSVAGNATSAIFAAAADERSPKKYTYYYALRARDASAKVSPLSANAAPDPHGTYVVGGNTNNCMTCHSVHGAAPSGSWALGAKSSEACYECHGTTGAVTGYGYASTFNTQAKFWDYAASPLPDSGSRHRNAYMDAQNEECDGCHTPHRKPYNEVAGVYNTATSHSKLLKRPTDPADSGSAMVYNTDAAPFDKAFCFSCHGSGAGQVSASPLTYMTEVGGSSAYANTAGDHNEAGSANTAVAHSSANVYATTRGAGDPGPLNTCNACHNEHASASAGLVDYRQSDTMASTYDQAGLCFACHSAGSTETRSVGSAPFAWNGRDVKAEFQRASHHPFVAAPLSVVPELVTWTQVSDTDFAADTLSGTVVYGTGPAAYVGLSPDVTPGMFVNAGSAVTPPITVMGGTLNSWQTLTLSGAQPAGSTIRFDVLDAATNSVITGYGDLNLASSPVSLVAIDKNAYPGIKLRARLTGDGTPSSVTPQLDGWSVSYVYTPSPAQSSLTCYNCHNTHYVNKGSGAWSAARVSNADNTKQLYTGTNHNTFCLACHDGTPPTAITNQAGTLIPYDVVMTDMSAYPFFPGWNKAEPGLEFQNSRHGGGGPAPCKTCHDPHGSNFARLNAYTGGTSTRANTNAAVSKEQNLCMNSACHGGTGATHKVSGPFSQTYVHPITRDDRHADTEGSAGLGATNRHSECVDCHDPHAAVAGRHTVGQSVAGGALKGAIGVDPAYSSTNWTAATSFAPARMTGSSTDYEAYVCFRCHSSYTTQPASVTRNSRTYTPTDIAREFNPANQSGHNVMGNVWPKTTTAQGLQFNLGFPTSNVFKTGWTTSSMVTCSDCHSGQTGSALGPHGSSVEYLLDSAYTTTWRSTAANLSSGATGGLGMPTTLICAKCHDLYDGNNWGNIVHEKHQGRGIDGGYCTHCHVGVPHGWQRPRLLGYTDDPAPYAVRSDGLSGFAEKSYTPTSWQKADCGSGSPVNGSGGCTGTSRHPVQTNRWD